MAPPDKSNLQKYWLYFTIAYASYKALKAISNLKAITSSEHTILQDSSKLQKSKQNISPQYFVNSKGLWIYHRDWILPQDVGNLGLTQPKGVVIVCHGLAEHIGRYEHFAKKLNSLGFAVYGIDHQGHGQSDGDRCYVKNFDDYVSDILVFSERIRLEYNNSKQNCKLFLFGHSMGGLIAALVAYKAQMKYKHVNNGNNSDNSKNKNENELKSDDNSSNGSSNGSCMEGPLFDGGIILSSPALGIAPEQDLPPAAKALARKLASVVPKLPAIGLRNDVLSHEPTILYHLKKDPLHYRGLIPLQTVREIIDSQEIINDIAKNGGIKYPFLIFGGSKDQLCHPPSWETFYNNASSEDKTCEIFDGLYHETLNETENDQTQVFNTLSRWMLGRAGTDERDTNE